MKEALGVRDLARELKEQDQVVIVYYDNSSAIPLSKNQVYCERTKHINFKMHFVKEEIARESMKAIKVSVDHNLFDMNTKVLPSNKFFYCLDLIKLIRG